MRCRFTCSFLSRLRHSRAIAALPVTAVAVGCLAGCVNAPAVYTQLVEARRLASRLHVQFTRAADAANRAVMWDTDEGSTAAAEEARGVRGMVERDLEALRSTLRSLGYDQDLIHLESFATCLAEYTRLDDEILPLAVENTNLKAQRLSFGPARAAADELLASLDATVGTGAAEEVCRAEALAATARTAVLRLLVLQAPHIAESEDVAMTQIEEQMTASATAARRALDELGESLPPTAAPGLAQASAALDRLVAVNDEIVTLSRRNTNVRSLALSLGRKRVVAVECENRLEALEQALAEHEFIATR